METNLDTIPRGWFSPGGSKELRGRHGMYKEVALANLPPLLLATLDGTFNWLLKPAAGLDLMSYHEPAESIPLRLKRLAAEAKREGLTVPAPFVKFMTDKNLYGRVPSCTRCYFDLTARLIAVPGYSSSARMLRFMNDQHKFLLWYLLLTPDGGHRVACAYPEWIGDDSDVIEDAAEPRGLVVCAGSFEEFMKRFWIENTLWYAVHKGSPAIKGELRAYFEAMRSGD